MPTIDLESPAAQIAQAMLSHLTPGEVQEIVQDPDLIKLLCDRARREFEETLFRRVGERYNWIGGSKTCVTARRFKPDFERHFGHFCDECRTAKLIIEVEYFAMLSVGRGHSKFGMYHLHDDQTWVHIEGTPVRVRLAEDGENIYTRTSEE